LTPHGGDLYRPSQQIKWRNVSHGASCAPCGRDILPLAIMREPANNRNPQAAEPRSCAPPRFRLRRRSATQRLAFWQGDVTRSLTRAVGVTTAIVRDLACIVASSASKVPRGGRGAAEQGPLGVTCSAVLSSSGDH